MKLEQSVARHYTHGSLEPAILAALTAAGKDLDRLVPADLAPVDEFHIGGRQATADLAAQVAFGAGLHLLDIMIDNLERGLIAPTEIVSRAI